MLYLIFPHYIGYVIYTTRKGIGFDGFTFNLQKQFSINC
jgi:hypothetical protein